jgi:hypothetical protein
MTVSDRKSTSKYRWTLEEALQWKQFDKADPAIEHIVQQLGPPTDAHGTPDPMELRRMAAARRNGLNMYSVMSGAVAVRESLQLDGMGGTGINQMPGAASPMVDIDSLNVPLAKSHPFSQMLGDRRPTVSQLSCLVPADFFLVEARTLSALIETIATATTINDIVMNQAARQSVDAWMLKRVRTQLALNDELIQRLGGPEIEEVAITGSDVFLQDGADLALLVATTEAMNDQLLAAAENDVHLARLSPKVHVRASSRLALARIIGSCHDPRISLGCSSEFQYVRTLFEQTAAADRVFIYLSDPLIRRMISPQVRVAQKRRSICRENLMAINRSVLLYAANNGTSSTSLQDLQSGVKSCPHGGTYELRRDSFLPVGFCSVHGFEGNLTPLIETPVAQATPAEASEYKQFVDEYNQYWRTYFDPIAIQLTIDKNEYRAKTIVLPLIENSIYSGLKECLDISADARNALAGSNKTVMSLVGNIRKSNESLDAILVKLEKPSANVEVFAQQLRNLLLNGIGEQIGFHIWDAHPTFSLDIPSLFAIGLPSTANQQRMMMIGPFLWIAALFASLNRPVYGTVAVRDAKIVDGFLDGLNQVIAAMPMPGGEIECSKISHGDGLVVHCVALKLGPAKFRCFVSRLGDTLYISSQSAIIEEIHRHPVSFLLEGGHFNFEVFAENCDLSNDDLQLNWLDNSRLACMHNIAPLTFLSRAVVAVSGEAEVLPGDLMEFAQNYLSGATRRVCPDGGIYTFDKDLKCVSCSKHGGKHGVRQPSITDPASSATLSLLHSLARCSAKLTFLDDGLHGELIVRRRPSAAPKV